MNLFAYSIYLKLQFKFQVPQYIFVSTFHDNEGIPPIFVKHFYSILYRSLVVKNGNLDH